MKTEIAAVKLAELGHAPASPKVVSEMFRLFDVMDGLMLEGNACDRLEMTLAADFNKPTSFRKATCKRQALKVKRLIPIST